MKTRNLTYLIPVILSLSPFLNAAAAEGSHVGNGGDAVICTSGEYAGQTFLLDWMEANQRRGVVITQPEGKYTTREIVNEYLNRMNRAYDATAKQNSTIVNVLLNDIEAAAGKDHYTGELIRFASDNLNDIPDSYEISIPEGCEKKTTRRSNSTSIS